MIDINVFRDEGPAISGRGTPIAVENFNMKNAAAYATAYYPTGETVGAPLIRPLLNGEQTLSFKVYTFFVLSGTYGWIKNLRFRVSLETAADTGVNAQLFYRNTNVYATPDNAFDGNMMLLANTDGAPVSTLIYPMLSTVGPNSATSRQVAYNNVSPLYTNYFVTQLRINKSSFAGNTPEMKIKFEATEYYEV